MTGAGHHRLAGQFAHQAHDRLNRKTPRGAFACAAIAHAHAALVNVPDSKREQAAKQQDLPDPEIRAVRRAGRGSRQGRQANGPPGAGAPDRGTRTGDGQS
jgi:hypothetical protein